MKFPRSNLSLALNLAVLVAGMIMLAYASVPLYRVFCQVTGYGGTTQRISTHANQVLTRTINVHFNADIDANLPWAFAPGGPMLTAHVGENKLTYFTAKNLTNKPVTGHAVYNVVPHKAGPYFVKIECFCFQNQTLAANQEVHMPVSFYLDPALMDDPEMNDVHEITLSYTFFPATSSTTP